MNSKIEATSTSFKSLGEPPFATPLGYVAVAELSRAGLLSEVELVHPNKPLSGRQLRPQRDLRVFVRSRLGKIKLHRAWRYWVANGPVPLDAALKLYADPVGRKSVRVAGSCGCPPPEQWVEVVDGKPCITTYHIDTEEGLALFVAALTPRTAGWPTPSERAGRQEGPC